MAGSVILVIRRLAGRGGGAERVFCEQANMLARMGYRVTCLHYEWGRGSPAFSLDAEVARHNLWTRPMGTPGLPAVLRLASLGYSGGRLWAPIAWLSKHWLFVWRLARYFQKHRPDVVISYLPGANTPALLASLITGTKVIASHHNDPARDFLSREKWDPNPLDRSLRYQTLWLASRVHVLLDAYADFFSSPIREKVEVIHNYPTDIVRDSQVQQERSKIVVAVGRLSAVKNYGVLIAAWALVQKDFPDWKLQIFGKGELEASLRRQIEELGLQASVELKGYTGRIGEVYQSARLLAHPALYEGFPLSVLEALSSGLPVLAFAETSGVEALVRDGENGVLVPRGDGPAGLARGLSRLLSADEWRAELGAGAAASVAQYSKASYASRWREVIDDVIGIGSGPNNA